MSMQPVDKGVEMNAEASRARMELPKETFYETKSFIGRAFRNVRSLLLGGCAKLPKNPLVNPLFSCSNKIGPKLQESDSSCKSSSQRWEPGEGPNKKEDLLARSSKGSTSASDQSRSEDLQEEKTSFLAAENFAQKMEELEMMNGNDGKHLMDIDEVVRCYSLLTSPAYLEIVDKFSMDVYKDLNLPQPSRGVNNSLRKLDSTTTHSSMRKSRLATIHGSTRNLGSASVHSSMRRMGCSTSISTSVRKIGSENVHSSAKKPSSTSFRGSKKKLGSDIHGSMRKLDSESFHRSTTNRGSVGVHESMRKMSLDSSDGSLRKLGSDSIYGSMRKLGSNSIHGSMRKLSSDSIHGSMRKVSSGTIHGSMRKMGSDSIHSSMMCMPSKALWN